MELQANLKKVLFIMIALGILAKFYGFTDHWKNFDHYNYGGTYSMAATQCLKKTPLSISGGRVHTLCETEDPQYYPNHPPWILFIIWGMTEVLGDGEWVYRLFVVFFSILNIFLVYTLARTVWPRDDRPLWATMFHSIFLSGMYFGTHVDFICEFTFTFLILTTIFALRGRVNLSIFTALLAGISSWPGYIAFGPLFFYSWLKGRGQKRVFFSGVMAFFIALVTMAYLHGTWDIVEFLREKLFKNSWRVDKKQKDLLLPLWFAKNILDSYSRLLSPLFASMAFYELFWGRAKPLIRCFWSRSQVKEKWNLYHEALFLSMGTGIIYMLIGWGYFMVHVYLYRFMEPAMSLMCAHFVFNLLENKGNLTKYRGWVVLSILVLLVYPYGAYKIDIFHDVLASLFIAIPAIYFLSRKKPWRTGALISVIGASALGNFLQTSKYRNEPDTEHPFCKEAREKYLATGEPIETFARKTMTKEILYCAGIPIIYKEREPEGKDQ